MVQSYYLIKQSGFRDIEQRCPAMPLKAFDANILTYFIGMVC
jgi:hypothetical protein